MAKKIQTKKPVIKIQVGKKTKKSLITEKVAKLPPIQEDTSKGIVTRSRSRTPSPRKKIERNTMSGGVITRSRSNTPSPQKKSNTKSDFKTPSPSKKKQSQTLPEPQNTPERVMTRSRSRTPSPPKKIYWKTSQPKRYGCFKRKQ